MTYETYVRKELARWQRQMQQTPSLLNKLSKGMQTRINNVIPEKVHKAVTAAIKQMLRAVLFGAGLATARPKPVVDLAGTEAEVRDLIEKYKKTAAVEGGITGAGGILMGFADFPLFLGIKIKMLFHIAATYGFDVDDYRERVYLLHIFELAFSSQEHRQQVYGRLANWPAYAATLPEDINAFDWRSFQQEYRDYIDLAKLAQLIPGVGAVVGLVVNYRLTRRLGETAMNAYRMRLFHDQYRLPPA